MIDFSSHKILQSPSMIEYRLKSGNGQRVVKVWTSSLTPRIMAQMETVEGIEPTSLFADEVEEYLVDAMKRRTK